MDIKILYQDKFIIVAVKPANIPSQPDQSGQADMTFYLREKCGCAVFCVHRLDTKTSGVMVYAKTSEAAGKMSAALQSADSEKIYRAKCRGLTGSGTMTDYLTHDKRQNKSFVCEQSSRDAKKAVLDYEVTDIDSDGVSTIKVRLHTGRTHQIRVQLAERGFPVLGDGKYGSRDRCTLQLSCVHLAFMHPFKKRRMEFDI